MSATSKLAFVWVPVIAFMWVTPVSAQQTGGRTAGASLGGTTQGARAGQSFGASSNSNIALGSRFQSDASRFSGGSQSLGQTTAGLGALQGVVGGQQGGFGGGFGGRGGLGNSLLGLGAMGGFGRGGGGFGRGGLGQNGMNNANSQQGNKQIRTRLALGFTSPFVAKPDSPRVNAIRTAVTARLTRVLDRAIPASAGQVQARLDGSTVVLQGSVASEHQKKIAGLLAKMEPGVSDVKNELTVGRGGSTP